MRVTSELAASSHHRQQKTPKAAQVLRVQRGRVRHAHRWFKINSEKFSDRHGLHGAHGAPYEVRLFDDENVHRRLAIS